MVTSTVNITLIKNTMIRAHTENKRHFTMRAGIHQIGLVDGKQSGSGNDTDVHDVAYTKAMLQVQLYTMLTTLQMVGQTNLRTLLDSVIIATR